MKRCLLALPVAAFLAGHPAHAQTRQQALVDRATIALQEMLSAPQADDRRSALRQARAVMVCPQIFRAAFVIGGSGGDCVLLSRDGGGSWSAPAFFVMGSGGFGPQVGVQDSEFVMMILTRRGFDALLDSQFKFGGDASVAIATIGAGVEGSTTAALQADIVAYAKTRGLFAGVSLNGSILTSDTAWDAAYYGQDLAARQIVVQMQVNNPGANPLRAMLNQYGAVATAAPGYAPRSAYVEQSDAAPYTPDNRGGISQQSLPPPGH